MYEKIAVISSDKIYESRQDVIPDRIRLPDGREFTVAELTDQVTNRQTISRNQMARLNGRQREKTSAKIGRATKYTLAERQQIVNSTVSEIQEQYQLTSTQAYNLINNSRMVLGWNRVSRRDMR